MISGLCSAGTTPTLRDRLGAALARRRTRTNFLAASACSAFLFTAKAVGEPNVVTPVAPGRCGIGAMAQSTSVSPFFLASRMPEMYQVPIGSIAVAPVSNMVR